MENSIGDRIEEKYTRYLNCETDTLELTIEEAIFILETDESLHYVEDLLQEAYKVILSDYKRVLKENEELNYKLHSKKIALEIYNRYIPKSKVEEKIEELDKRIDFLNTELTKCYIEREKLGTETDIDNNETYIFYMEEEKNFREKQEEVLQELLREE